MKQRIFSDTILENIIQFLIEDETGGFIIDMMMKISKDLNKRLTNTFFYPMIKRVPRVIRLNKVNLSCSSKVYRFDVVECVAWSPDGQRIVSGSNYGHIIIWDAQTGEKITHLTDTNYHTNYMRNVAWSPDGQKILAGSDKTIIIWDAQTGKQIREILMGHTDCVRSVAWSPDGQKIVSGSDDTTVRIWDAQTGKQIWCTGDRSIPKGLTCHIAQVNSVAWSPDGQKIVTGSNDCTVRIWDAHSGKQIVKTIRGYTRAVYSVAWSPDSRRIVFGGSHPIMRMWSAITGKPIGPSLVGHTSGVTSVAWSPDEQKIVAGGYNGLVIIWDTKTGKNIWNKLSSSVITSVAWSLPSGSKACEAETPDGQRIISGSNVGTIKIWII